MSEGNDVYKTETHLHTSPVSSCARIAAREMIRLFHQAGYTTVFVSNHLYSGFVARQGEGAPWQQVIDAYLHDYDEARDEGSKLGMHVLLACELSIGIEHFLLYGIDRDWLLASEAMMDMDPAEFYAYAKASGITVVQAHPLRDRVNIPYPDCCDAIEAVNTNVAHENYDDETIALAKRHHKPMTGGSDAHKLEDIGTTAFLTDVPVTSAEQYISLVLSGGVTVMRHGEILHL